MNRGEIIKLSFLAILFAAWSIDASAAVDHPTGGVFAPPSPKVEAFSQELYRIPKKEELPGGVPGGISALSRPENGGAAPDGTVYPQITGRDASWRKFGRHFRARNI